MFGMIKCDKSWCFINNNTILINFIYIATSKTEFTKCFYMWAKAGSSRILQNMTMKMNMKMSHHELLQVKGIK